MNVVIASRVSTSIQDNRRQVEELKDFSKKMNYDVVNVFEEIISGAKKNEERPELMKMIQYIHKELIMEK